VVEKIVQPWPHEYESLGSQNRLFQILHCLCGVNTKKDRMDHSHLVHVVHPLENWMKLKA